MKKVIYKYLCDHCGKEVRATDEHNPLNSNDIRFDDRHRSGCFWNAQLQLCDDCNKKLMKDIDSVVSFLRNHWVKEEVET